MSSLLIATVDFHVTSECSQGCPYCWGPQDFQNPVDTTTALRIVSRVKEIGARRIVFTGGDPLKRLDLGVLIDSAKSNGLEVALSTTGDQLTESFLEKVGPYIDLISLPLDGSTEEVSSRTKEKGHFSAVMHALELLRLHHTIDVKLCTPVTRHNLADAPNILRLADEYAQTTKARVFYNIFQTYPRSMGTVDWNTLLVTDEEFVSLERQIAGQARIRISFLDHETLDRLYVLIFPDGTLVIPSGRSFLTFGLFLEIEVENIGKILESAKFDSAKHFRHSWAWEKDKAGTSNTGSGRWRGG